MRLAFRTDATDRIGTGHFMRCLTLADAMRRRGARTRFLGRTVPPHLARCATERGHELVALSSGALEPLDDLPHAAWLGTSQAADARDTARALSDGDWDWIVVDHYALDARWERTVRQAVRRVFAIDDLADREHDCDLLLDQNYYEDMDTRYDGKAPPGCERLLGPSYAMLRDEFRRARESVRPRTGTIERVLVFFGGVDAEDYTGRAIEALASLGIRVPHADVVIGAGHPRREAIERACARHGMTCHVQTDRMADLMAAADLAIGAAGSASWERCCLALPAITVATAGNQVPIAAGLEALGVAVSLGDGAGVTAAEMAAAFQAIAGEPDRVRRMSAAAARAVDGAGVDRVCDRLVSAA